jgi:hypothetical protein
VDDDDLRKRMREEDTSSIDVRKHIDYNNPILPPGQNTVITTTTTTDRDTNTNSDSSSDKLFY